MAITQVSVCNSALIKVGSDPISSITQDTRSARLLNAIYDQMRDSTLRAHKWNFASKRAILSPNSTTPDFEYDFTYDIPADCLRVLETSCDGTSWVTWGWNNDKYSSIDDFVVEGKTILSNSESLYAKYIYRNEDESSWDSNFAEAFAWRLAMELSYSLMQSLALRQDCEKVYKQILAEARSMDGAEGILKGLIADDWTNSRR